MTGVRTPGRLLAVSDLHASVRGNKELVENLRPQSPGDWLVVAGDVAETAEEVHRTMAMLADRFETVVWTPGNHELWTLPSDGLGLRGEARYLHLVEMLGELGVVTPEDPYPVFRSAHGPRRIAPLFLLYDYTWLPEGATSKAQGMAVAKETGLAFKDEALLHPDPYPSREAWCSARVAHTERRLAQVDDPDVPLVLVNHYPLVREPTRVLRHPHLAMWCGTRRTESWHRRFHVACVLYGHLHIPRRTVHDGVPFHEVSIGYPREWQRHGHPHGVLRRIDLSAATGLPAGVDPSGGIGPSGAIGRPLEDGGPSRGAGRA
ncbi:metallophosphoesterase family protein [Streptomyces sp. NPDC021093]|uniref:metallophosphoesterase family protein n=1 Tax=Streptomyces sp. NPDC021093 TaxID=3365112 RepID=UPI0037BE025B